MHSFLARPYSLAMTFDTVTFLSVVVGAAFVLEGAALLLINSAVRRTPYERWRDDHEQARTLARMRVVARS